MVACEAKPKFSGLEKFETLYLIKSKSVALALASNQFGRRSRYGRNVPIQD